MANTTYHVRVSTIVEDGEESKELGERQFSASSLEDAEAQRDKFAESCMEHARQSHSSTMWVYDSEKEDWTELGTCGVICWL